MAKEPSSGHAASEATSGNSASVEITVANGSCLVRPCEVTLKRGGTVVFQLASSDDSLREVKVHLGHKLILESSGKKVTTFDLTSTDATQQFDVATKAHRGRNPYRVTAHLQSQKPLEGECPPSSSATLRMLVFGLALKSGGARPTMVVED